MEQYEEVDYVEYGTPCIFPFSDNKYTGRENLETFNVCARDYENYPYCAVEVDADGVGTRFGLCTEACPRQDPSNSLDLSLFLSADNMFL